MTYASKILSVELAVVLPFFLTSCGELTEMQASLAKLDQGAHSAATTQSAFLIAYQKSECRSTNVDQIFAFTDGTSEDLELNGQCKAVGVTNADLTIRNDLMAALVLYVDKLQTLASSSSLQKLDSNSQALAKSINSFGKTSGLSNLQISPGTDSTIAHEVETAIIELSDLVLEEKITSTISATAAKN